MSLNKEVLYLPSIVGKGYKDFWDFKGRYKVVKGSRASKKSKTTALYYIVNMMKYTGANLLVIRKTYRTLKDSCFTELKWAINRLKVDKYWHIKESPLEMTYLPSGQKIYFRGLDDPLKITSITVNVGSLCWLWCEEAYEITKENDFDMLDESIRGQVVKGLFKQITLTFNPWNEKHWLKKRFFDINSKEILAMTTNYLCNEWLDESDLQVFENMKINNPRRYQVAGLGNWGVVDGLVYENWKEEYYTLKEIQTKYNLISTLGLDFGYTNDESAFFVGFIDLEKEKIFVYDEFYKKGLSNKEIYELICAKGYAKERIVADCSEPKSIDELKGYGLRVTGAKKGSDSINAGIQFIKNFEIIIHPKCVNFITEISNYIWDKDRFGKTINKPIDEMNHLMDAMRYAVEKYTREQKVKIKTFKGGI